MGERVHKKITNTIKLAEKIEEEKNEKYIFLRIYFLCRTQN